MSKRIPTIRGAMALRAFAVLAGCSTQAPAAARHEPLPEASVTPQRSTSAAPAPNSSNSPTASSSETWMDINGRWCDESGSCLTISNLKAADNLSYVFGGEIDEAGCLLGTVSNGEDGAMVALCPPQSPFDLSASCGIPEDVSRDRLYVYQGCSDPMYRG